MDNAKYEKNTRELKTREIEFRVYDTRLGKYRPLHLMYSDGYVAVKAPSPYYPEILSPGDIAVEQFTGFRDKNGKKIYEGDYVVVGEYCKPGLVEWSFLDGRLVVNWAYLGEAGHDEQTTGFDYGEASRCKIVGNVHEGLQEKALQEDKK